MSIKLSFLAAIVGTAAFGANSRLDCGTPDPGQELINLHQKLAVKEILKRDEIFGSMNVDTYIHVVANDTSPAGGWVNVITVQQQKTRNKLLTRQ